MKSVALETCLALEIHVKEEGTYICAYKIRRVSPSTANGLGKGHQAGRWKQASVGGRLWGHHSSPKWAYKEIGMLCSESGKTRLLMWIPICHLTEVKAPQNIHGYNQVCWYKFEEVWELLLKLLCLLSFLLPSVLLPLSLVLLSTTVSISGLQRKEDLLFCCQLQPYPWLQVGTGDKRCELLAALQLSKGAGFLHGSWLCPETKEQGDREEGHSCYLPSEHQDMLLTSYPNFPMQCLGANKTFTWRSLTALP